MSQHFHPRIINTRCKGCGYTLRVTKVIIKVFALGVEEEDRTMDAVGTIAESCVILSSASLLYF